MAVPRFFRLTAVCLGAAWPFSNLLAGTVAQFIPPGADWFLIGAFAAYSGAGGVSNLMLANWARDKGFGMGAVVGYIPAAVGGHSVKLAHSGSVFPINDENLARWRQWWRVVALDQWGVFFTGALLGMALPAILYTIFIEAGRDIRGMAIAAELAFAHPHEICPTCAGASAHVCPRRSTSAHAGLTGVAVRRSRARPAACGRSAAG